jgi:hypothetical protein
MGNMGEKRDTPRIPLMVRVDAMWQDETGTVRVVPGVLEDRSRGGVSVRVKEQISVGSRLEIRWQREQFSGTITHCRRDGVSYILGIQRDPLENNKPE